MNNIIGVYGASGFGREVIPIVSEQSSGNYKVVFIDDAGILDELNGYEVYTYARFLEKLEAKSVVIAIADSKVRENISVKLEEDGIEQLDVIASNSIVMDANEFEQGLVLCPFTTITSNVKIGRSFHANIYSYVAHDCVIGDYVTFAPGVKCNGNVHIEDHAYIGTGAVIKQGTPDRPLIIGKGAVVGMGAVVTKSVKAGDVVFGNPAKSIKRGK